MARGSDSGRAGFDYDGAVYAVVCNNQTASNGFIPGGKMVCVWSLSILNTKDIFISYEEDPRIVGEYGPMEG